MEEIGLMPSSTGRPGGRKTGQQMAHYIIKGGRFEALAARLIADNFKISWGEEDNARKEKESAQMAAKKVKTKYSCPSCNANVWGKPGLKVICGSCGKIYAEQAINIIGILGEKPG
jgi:ribosomal protein L37AE/L43A